MAANSRFAVATHIMTSLAFHTEGPLSSTYLASSVNTNPVVIRRILGSLQAAGLIATTAGKAGGAELARPSYEITLAQVYEAVEAGEVFRYNLADPNKKCPVSCAMKSVLEPIFLSANRALGHELKSYRLSDLVLALKKKGVDAK